MRKKLATYFKGDKILWMVIGALLFISILAVFSSTGTLAYKYRSGDTTYYLFRHIKFLFIGLIIIYIVHRIPYRYFSRVAQLLFLISIPLLLITLLLGVNINDASRWLRIPIIGIEFQTSDLAKIALIMYIARLLSQNQDAKDDLHNVFRPLIIAISIVCILILPANFSTALLLFFTSFVLMFIGRIPFKYLLSVIGMLIVALAFFVLIAKAMPDLWRFKTWESRIENFFKGDQADPTKNYQAEQSKIAIASGGFLGKGPGNSTQRNFLPHPYSDFIFAIIVEEYGFMGAFMVVFLYLLILFRTIIIVKRCDRTFAAFLSIGLTLMLVLQALTNMAVAVNLIPVTGQTLPFISMGGTSIMFISLSFGIIISVSRSIKETEEEIEGNVVIPNEKQEQQDHDDNEIDTEQYLNQQEELQKEREKFENAII